MRNRIYVALLGALVLGACEWNPFGGSDAGYLLASLQGAVVGEYEGSGEFSSGEYPWGITVFNLSSTSDESSFGFHHYGHSARLPAGTYSLELLRGVSEEIRGTRALYTRRAPEGLTELYVATSGTLNITESSGSRVRGTFEFSGVRYCLRDESTFTDLEGPCSTSGIADPVPSDLPRISVSGSFAATPWDNRVNPPDPTGP